MVVLLSCSGCWPAIADCFCGPAQLSIAEGQLPYLAPVPRGCARTDPFFLRNATPRTSPPLTFLSANSSNPAITVQFPDAVVNETHGEFIRLQVITEAPLSGPSQLETEIELVTDTGSPRTLTFHLSVPVVPQEALPALDFGGVTLGTTATQPYSFVPLLGDDLRRGFTRIDGPGFAYAALEPFPHAEFRFSPQAVGPSEGSLTLDVYSHCPLLERLPLRGDGVAQVLTATPAAVDFGDVPVGTTATRTIEVANAALTELRLTRYLDSDDFQAAFSTTPIVAAHRDAQGQLVLGRTLLEVTFTPRTVGPQAQQMGAIANTLMGTSPLNFHVTGAGR